MAIRAQWEDARAIFSEISTGDLSSDPTLLGHNNDVSLLGYQGTLAARLGDSAATDSIDNRLATMDRPWLWGHAAYWRGAMAAVRGDSAAATARLSEAMNLGLFAEQWGTEYPKWDYHIDPDFRPLLDYPPFEDLVGPRD